MNRSLIRMQPILLLLGALAVSPLAHAAKSCKAPAIPSAEAVPGSDLNSRWKDFQDQMNQYRDCIVAYQKSEIADAKHHQELANDAVAQFNDFIKKVKAAQQEMKDKNK